MRSTRTTPSVPTAVVVILLVLATACASDQDATTPTPSASPLASPAFGLRSELVSPADHAAALAFASDGRLFYAEQYSGDIRIVSSAGELLPEPFAHIDVANWLDLDWGLTGLALDPDFASNHYVYAFYSEPVDPNPLKPIARPKLVRFTDQDDRGVELTTITDEFPETFLDHQGFLANGSIHFGPDGSLYLTIGDYDQGHRIGPNGVPYAQDLSSPLGKILRLDKADGTAPTDNPLAAEPGADPRTFAYGFAQGFDFAFHPASGQIYGSDNTDSCEEVNLVQPGGNYGAPPAGEFPFPDCSGEDQINAIHLLARPGMQPGQFQSPVNVSGMAFVSAGSYPLLGDALVLCESTTRIMRRLVLAGADFNEVADDDTVAFDCNRGVTVSPDGTIYYSNDNEIRRLVAATS